MKKKIGSFSTFGKVLIGILAIAMVVYFYTKFPDQPFYIRIFEGLWRFVVSIFGAGLIYLVLFFAMYGAVKLCDSIYVHDDCYTYEGMMEDFQKITEPISVVCFVASYIIVFLQL